MYQPAHIWEGKYPSPDGSYKLCFESSLSMMCDKATDGRVKPSPHALRDAGGAGWYQGIWYPLGAQELASVTGRVLHWQEASQPFVRERLDRGLGVMIAGKYSAVPKNLKNQVGFNGGHEMYADMLGGQNVSVYDPLAHAAQLWPVGVVWNFLATYNYSVGWIDAEAAPVGGESMIKADGYWNGRTITKYASIPAHTAVYVNAGDAVASFMTGATAIKAPLLGVVAAPAGWRCVMIHTGKLTAIYTDGQMHLALLYVKAAAIKEV